VQRRERLAGWLTEELQMTVIAANEVASRAYKQGDGQFIYIAGLIGRPGKPNEGPQALHVHQPPPMVVGAHFHKVNQWQLVIAGSGAFGHHRVDGSTSVLFHYTDHDTPYGPITAEADGISYLTLRAHSSGGIWYMPKDKGELAEDGGHGRNITMRFDCDGWARGETGQEAIVGPFKDGVAGYVLKLGPGDKVAGFPSSGTGGQYYVVLRGSLQREDAGELTRASCIWVAPDSELPRLVAGPDGAAVGVMQFAEGS
jgi:hypothetical protein